MSEPSTPPTEPAVPAVIKYDDFAKADLKVGNIIEAKVHDKADKLMIMQVRVGDEVRQIVAGIRGHYEPEALLGKQVIVVTNLEPRKVRGEQSNGMILAASDGSGTLALVQPDKTIAAGSQVR